MTDPIDRPEFFDTNIQPEPFKKLLYALTFFHAVIQERKKYGALGWNIAYEFNESDLRISVRQLYMFLQEDETGTIPFKALKYMTSECYYGGRVTDDKDRILINTLLEGYYNQEVVSDKNYLLASNPIYKVPSFETHTEYLDYIRTLPMDTDPEVFGFNQNADITKNLNETNLLLDSLLLCSESGSSVEGASTEDILKKIIQTILHDFPEEFNVEKVMEKYPVKYEESMNTVLTQELTRFNRLIAVNNTRLNLSGEKKKEKKR
jgi:dynein heavy chain, axonemal